jgi:glutamine synthetase
MLAAGLDGIRNDLESTEATEEDLFTDEDQRKADLQVLPGSLDQAIDAGRDESSRQPWEFTCLTASSAPNARSGKITAWR